MVGAEGLAGAGAQLAAAMAPVVVEGWAAAGAEVTIQRNRPPQPVAAAGAVAQQREELPAQDNWGGATGLVAQAPTLLADGVAGAVVALPVAGAVGIAVAVVVVTMAKSNQQEVEAALVSCHRVAVQPEVAAPLAVPRRVSQAPTVVLRSLLHHDRADNQ